MKGSVLIVDDDLSAAQAASNFLTVDGYKVKHAADSNVAYAALKKDPYDLVLLDIEMPGISGMKLLEILKQDPKTARIPVIMLSVRKEESYKVQGLKTGADDYLPKPYSGKELLARVEALLRRVRNQGSPGNLMRIAEVEIDADTRMVTVSGKKITLTPTEFEILSIFMRRPGNVITYRNLTESFSAGAREMTSETMYGHVKDLRKKLGKAGRLIETVYGSGYRFNKE